MHEYPHHTHLQTPIDIHICIYSSKIVYLKKNKNKKIYIYVKNKNKNKKAILVTTALISKNRINKKKKETK